METAFRSLNNLLERFHHAYWFYFMPSGGSFIPISKYAGPIACLISCFVFISLDLWLSSESITTIDSNLQAKPRPDFKYVQRPLGSLSFSNKSRPIYISIILLVTSFVYPLYIFNYIDTITEFSKQDLLHGLYMFVSIMVGQQTTAWFMIPLIQRLIAGDAGSSRITISGVWVIFKSFISASYGVFLFSLLTMNPSLALIISILTVPMVLLMKPSYRFSIMALQSILLVLLSPPMLLLGYGIMNGFENCILFLGNILASLNYFTGIFIVLITCVYWPLNIASQVLVTMEP